MGIECPKCHTESTSDSEFCKKCATQLPPSEEISTSPTKTLETPVKDLTTGMIIAGKYKLLEDLGEGGMGTMFVAEQTEPVQRRVAVKIIKLEMDTKQLI